MQCSVSWKGATFSHIGLGSRWHLHLGAAGYTHNTAHERAAGHGVRKKPRTRIYANKGSMATTRKQSVRTGMGRASAGRCRACTHDGHVRAWHTLAMNMYAHAKGFVDVDCV